MKDLEADAYQVLRNFVRGEEKREKERRKRAFRKAKRKDRSAPNFPKFIFFKEVMEMVHAEDGGSTAWVLKDEKDAWFNARRAIASP